MLLQTPERGSYCWGNGGQQLSLRDSVREEFRDSLVFQQTVRKGGKIKGVNVDPETWLQWPGDIPVEAIAVVFVVLWLIVAVLIVRIVIKRFAGVAGLLRQAASGQDQGKLLGAVEKLLPMVKTKAFSPQSARAMRKQLSKKLKVPAEMIHSYTVRGQLAAYGVSEESMQVVEQILRSGETEQYGYTPPAPQEISLRDILKASQEIEARLPKH